MARQDRIGTHKTSVFTDKDGYINVVYHSTPVVKFNADRIILNTGGYDTKTTKTRMNQTSNQFALGFRVYQKDWDWYVEYKRMTYPFDRQIGLKRQSFLRKEDLSFRP